MRHVLSLVNAILSVMLANKPFFTKTFTQPLAVIRRMASPEGTTVNELAECLSLTRRSVFRLIRAIEREFRIPVETKKPSAVSQRIISCNFLLTIFPT